MQLSKFFVPTLLLAITGLSLAQPAPPAKQETTDEFMARYKVERKARITSDFQKQLRDKFKLSDNDINDVQLFMARQDGQLQIVRKALYQITLADSDPDTKDEEYAVFWNDFQTLLTKYRTQKAQDTAKLSEQLHLGQNTRLLSFLTMRGIIGDDLLASTPMSETFTNSDLLSYSLKKEMGAEKPKRVVAADEKPNG